MGIRLAVRMGYSLLSLEKITLLEELFKQGQEQRNEKFYGLSEVEINTDFLEIVKKESFEELKAVCSCIDLDPYQVHLSLFREKEDPSLIFEIRDFRDKSEALASPAVKGCEFLAKKKRINPLFFCMDPKNNSRYGNILDTNWKGDSGSFENKIKFLGSGIWPITGYVAKKDFSNGSACFKKGKAYYWGDVAFIAKAKLAQAKITLRQAESKGIVPSVIGLSEEFHPAVSDDVLYLIYCLYAYANKASEFKKEDWMFELYPCVIEQWC